MLKLYALSAVLCIIKCLMNRCRKLNTIILIVTSNMAYAKGMQKDFFVNFENIQYILYLTLSKFND